MFSNITKAVKERRDRASSNLKGAFAQFQPKTWKTAKKGGGDGDGDGDGGDDNNNKGAVWRAKLAGAHAVMGAKRLKNVFVAPLVANAAELLGFVPPDHLKTDEERSFLDRAMEGQAFVYSRLAPAERRALLGGLEKVTLAAGDVLYRQGEPSEHLYVLQIGTVEFRCDPDAAAGEEGKDSPVGGTTTATATATDGVCFGELALMYNTPQAHTCTAVTACILWRLERDICRKILASYTIGSDGETRDLLKTVPLLKTLDDDFLTRIAYALSSTTYNDGDVIYKKGDTNVAFCIVRSGKAVATDVDLGDAKLSDVTFHPGEAFGVRAIVNDEPAQGNVTAVGETTLLWLTGDMFKKLFGGMDRMLQGSVDRKMLQHIPAQISRTDMPGYELDALVDLIVDYKIPAGHVFMKEARTTAPALYLIRSGKVSIHSSAEKLAAGLAGIFGYSVSPDSKGEATVGSGGYFGSDLLKEGQAERVVSKYTVTATEDCVVGVLTMKTIWSVIGGRVEEGELNVDEYERVKLLGAGTFGRVFLVAKQQSAGRHAYALKVQKKRALIQYGMVTGVMQERDIMVRLNHPLIIRLVNSAQDDPNLYMLTELYQGGELRAVMDHFESGMPEEAAAFYAGGILEAVSFMHLRRTLHRDLKPENVLLDGDGYAVLIDLGFAKVVQNDKTFTFCGTPMYLAPEIILQHGYGKSADIWSWAVMLYEMLVTVTPFYEPEMTQMALFRSIVRGKFEFPPFVDFMSDASMDLLTRTLVVKPTHRLGCQAGGARAIKEHEWFAMNKISDFALLGKKEVRAPWTPPASDPLSEGGSCHDEEEDAQSKTDKPLSEAEQKLFKDF